MGYRGQDLDLRTPQSWRATPSETGGSAKGPNGPATRPGSFPGEPEIPIWVDDTVLACCNHAFDVALAHRSGEVRVEHLLHALTRIDAATEILEASGIRTSSLRRETATVIASEIPLTLTNGNTTPRRADTFEEVLRLAAAHAYQRNAPVSVEDLLYVFFEIRPTIHGLELIDHHYQNQTIRRERPERPMPAFRRMPAPPAYVPPPPAVEPRAYEPRAYEPRAYEPRERIRRPSGRFLIDDAGPAGLPPQPETVQAATDHLQNSRLDVLEQMVRAISTQITSQRDDASRFSGGLFDRLQSLETMVSSRSQTETADLGPLLRRLDEIEHQIRLNQPRDAGIDLDLDPVLLKIAALERAVLNTKPPEVDVDLSKIERRLEDIERHVTSSLVERFNGLTSKLAALEDKSDTSEMMTRLELIEEALLGADRSMSGDLDSRIASLGEAVSLQQATLDDARASLAADIREVNATLHEHSARIARAGEGLGDVVRAIEGLRDEERNTLAHVRQLLSGFQTHVQTEISGFVSKSNELVEVHNAELKEVHDALMKLNANQHTLAGSIDQWRNDETGDLSIIAKRIEGLEHEASRPMALLETLSTNMESMHRLTVERYHRRNRLWYWLFGTDDWVAASWPSQAGRIEAERRALRQVES